MGAPDYRSAAEVVAVPGVGTQAMRFALVGLLNTATTLLIIAALRQWAGASVWLASGIGYGAGTVQSYVLNRWWTFAANSTGASGREQFLRFVAANIVLALLFSVLNEVIARRFILVVATSLALAVVVPISFVTMRLFVFRWRRA